MFFRIHPLESRHGKAANRYCPTMSNTVPEPGLTLPDGRHIPAGTTVGVNPAVVTRDRGTYGSDADNFRPERWLKAEDETAEAYARRLRTMDEIASFVWSGGNRTCLGRSLATAALYKLTALLFGRYDIELAEDGPGWEWERRPHYLMANGGVNVRLSRKR